MPAASCWREGSCTSMDDLGPSDAARGVAERPPAPSLGRDAPLVPTDGATGRALAAVIAILTFLAALCAGTAEIVAANAAAWQGQVAQEITLQVRPTPGRDVEGDVARAAEVARALPGIGSARPLSKDESERLLEPWLGTGLDLGDLPVPRLVVVRLAGGARPDMGLLRRRLGEALPAGIATVDDHGMWLSRLSTAANTLVGMGIAVVALVLLAAALAVTFATRGAMAGNREVVEVLHLVGARDDFIAREFQRRFFRLGLKGGLVGAGAALAVLALAGAGARAWRSSPAGEEIEALFGAFDVGWRGYASVVLIGIVASIVTGIVSRVTVRRHLAGTSGPG